MPIPQQKEAVSRTTAKERIYHTLRQWIIDGTLEPGERLNDVELAQHFAVSRTPVREALQLLKEQRLVSIVPSSGTYVAPIDDQDMRHVYQLLVALQSLAMELCIQTVTPEQLERLFQPFYRPGTSAPGGSGLGLSICKEIMTAQDGDIQILSSPDTGTRVVLYFQDPKKPQKWFNYMARRI